MLGRREPGHTIPTTRGYSTCHRWSGAFQLCQEIFHLTLRCDAYVLSNVMSGMGRMVQWRQMDYKKHPGGPEALLLLSPGVLFSWPPLCLGYHILLCRHSIAVLQDATEAQMHVASREDADRAVMLGPNGDGNTFQSRRRDRSAVNTGCVYTFINAYTFSQIIYFIMFFSFTWRCKHKQSGFSLNDQSVRAVPVGYLDLGMAFSPPAVSF